MQGEIWTYVATKPNNTKEAKVRPVLVIGDDSNNLVDEVARVYDFTLNEGNQVMLYPIWKQVSFNITLTDGEQNGNIIVGSNAGQNSVTIEYLYDEITSIGTLMSKNDISLNPYSFGEVYSYPTHFVYTSGDGEENIIYFDDLLKFCLAPQGFINGDDFTDDNVVLEVVYEEISYNIHFNLLGGRLEYNSSGLFANYDDSTGLYTLEGDVLYSDLKNGFIIDEYFDMDENAITKEIDGIIYTFAGWAIQEENPLILSILKGEEFSFSFSDGENIQEILNPKDGFVFEFYAVYNDKIITISTENGNIITPGQQIDIGMQSWTSSDYDVYTYSYYGASLELITSEVNLYYLFEYENYHVNLEEVPESITVEETLQSNTIQIVWEGNTRYVVLDSIYNNGSSDYVGGQIVVDDAFTSDSFEILTLDGNEYYGYKEVETPSEGHYAYIFNNVTDESSFKPYDSSVDYDKNTKFYEKVTNRALIIKTRYGVSIDNLSLVSVENQPEGKVFKGWMNDYGVYSNIPLLVQGDDSSIIYLTANYEDNIYVSFNLNEGTYDGNDYINPRVLQKDEKGQFVKIPASSSDAAGIGPSKWGYDFLGWSTYKNYDEFVSAGSPTKSLITAQDDEYSYYFSEQITEDLTLYAIYKPRETTFRFSNIQSAGENPTEKGEYFTITAKYGQTLDLPNLSDNYQDANKNPISNWKGPDANDIFMGWMIYDANDNPVNYDEGGEYILRNDRDFASFTGENNSPSLVQVYTRWAEPDVILKLYVGLGNVFTRDYAYFGDETQEGFERDSVGVYMRALGRGGERYKVPRLEDFYLRNMYASGLYYDSTFTEEVYLD